MQLTFTLLLSVQLEHCRANAAHHLLTVKGNETFDSLKRVPRAPSPRAVPSGAAKVPRKEFPVSELCLNGLWPTFSGAHRS